MKNVFTRLTVPALISLFLVIPFILLEVVNRRSFNEDFPFMLFFVLWLNLFAVSFILLPVVRATQKGDREGARSITDQGNSLLTAPRSTAFISVILVLCPILISWLNSLGWAPLDRLFNGTHLEDPYILGQVLSLLLIAIPIAAGVIASGPIVRTLLAGGSLFAHPIHLIIVIVTSFFFAASVIGLIVVQLPCFMGVPVCD